MIEINPVGKMPIGNRTNWKSVERYSRTFDMQKFMCAYMDMKNEKKMTNKPIEISPELMEFLKSYREVRDKLENMNAKRTEDFFDMMGDMSEKLVKYYDAFSQWNGRNSDMRQETLKNIRRADTIISFITNEVLLGDTVISKEDFTHLMLKIEHIFCVIEKRMQPIFMAAEIKRKE